MAAIKVLVVDGYPLTRDAMRMLIELESEMEVVGAAHDSASAVRMARDLAPTIVVIDIDMPIANGIEATRRIVAENPGIRVLAYSENCDAVWDAMDAGAFGFVSKFTAPLELLRRIRDTATSTATLHRASAGAPAPLSKGTLS